MLPSVIVPLTPGSNQTLSCTLPVDSKNITMTFQFTYNAESGYWFMSVKDNTGALLLDAVPLLTGKHPAANILEPYQYLGIGSAYLVPTSNGLTDLPNFENLGTDFVLVWSDTSN